MVINNNIAALNTLNKLNANSNAAISALEKLSSGLRINRAADDAAGLAISQKMLAQINGLSKAADNAQNGISMIQTAEGALSQSQSILQRMNELAVQAANGTNSTTDKEKLQDELDQLVEALNDISDQTSFNGSKILLSADGTNSTLFNGTGITLQVGAFSGQTLVVKVAAGATAVDATGLGVDSLDLTNDASGAITLVNKAISSISTYRSKLGAYQNQLNHTINNLNTENENLSQAKSRITDVDMAAEMSEFTKNNILVQAATAMLAQANQLPQGILSLLK